YRELHLGPSPDPTEFAIQFRGEGLSGDHLPPAPRVVRGKPQPMYVIIVEADALNFSIASATNEMRALPGSAGVRRGARCLRHSSAGQREARHMRWLGREAYARTVTTRRRGSDGRSEAQRPSAASATTRRAKSVEASAETLRSK